VSQASWKGLASYYTVEVDGERAEDGAFYYAKPSFLARKVKSRIAFWKGVRVVVPKPRKSEFVP